VAATYNTIINMTHISGEIISPLEGGILSPLEPNWTQVASTFPSVDAPAAVQKRESLEDSARSAAHTDARLMFKFRGSLTH